MSAPVTVVEPKIEKSSRNYLLIIMAVIILLIAAFLVVRPRGAHAVAPAAGPDQTQQAH